MATTTRTSTLDTKSLPEFEVFAYLPEAERKDTSCTDSAKDSSRVPSSTGPDQQLSLKISASWTYCGPLLTLNPSALPTSFHTWADATLNGSILSPLFSFLDFVHTFLETNSLSHYWLTIRATKGSHDYDIPRWHTDDRFFIQKELKETPLNVVDTSPNERRPSPRRKSSKPKSELDRKFLNLRLTPDSRQDTSSQSTLMSAAAETNIPPEDKKDTDWKLATTLLGPGTRFITRRSSSNARAIRKSTLNSVRAQHKDHLCCTFKCLGCNTAIEQVRGQLAEALKDHETFQAGFGECTYFRMGEEEGAIHSEPESHGDRIFVNIVPGEEKELMALIEKWGLEYPRAWCVGLPMMPDEECLRDVWEPRE